MIAWPPCFSISAVIWQTPAAFQFFSFFTVAATSSTVGGGSSSGAVSLYRSLTQSLTHSLTLALSDTFSRSFALARSLTHSLSLTQCLMFSLSHSRTLAALSGNEGEVQWFGGYLNKSKSAAEVPYRQKNLFMVGIDRMKLLKERLPENLVDPVYQGDHEGSLSERERERARDGERGRESSARGKM